MNDQINGLIAAIGGVVEMSKLMYDECISKGFTENQAMFLVGRFIDNTLTPPRKEDLYE